MKPNREQLAWAAGFFDGEGHVGLMKFKDKPGVRVLRMVVGNTNPAPLARFILATGMQLKLAGPYVRKKPRFKEKRSYQCHCYGLEKVQAVVAMLWPFLCIEKKAQAAAALRDFHTHYAERQAAQRLRS